MIYLYYGRKRVGGFRYFEDLTDYFNRLEDEKLTDYNIYQAQRKWKFQYVTYKNPHNDESYLNEGQETVVSTSLDQIVICWGDPQESYSIIVTPEIDIIHLMREWCFDYAFEHGYKVFECLDVNSAKDNSGNFTEEKLFHETTIGK